MTSSLIFCRWNVGCLRAVSAAMPDTATILRTTPASTPGGWTQTYAAAGTTPCRIVGLPAPSEVPVAAQLASLSRWRMEVPNGTVIHLTDRIQVMGKTFEVLGQLDKSFNVTDTYYLAEVRRI